MRHTIWLAGALLLMMVGCREESDSVLSYAFNDRMAFAKADTSFAGKFDVIWNGMNVNYALWDYEKENGLDWDAVYDKYYPRFAALDAVDTLVSDRQLQELLEEVLSPLHDGHLYVQVINHVTENSVRISPASLRIERERIEEQNTAGNMKPSVAYYVATGDVLETRQISTQTFLPAILTTISSLSSEISLLIMKESRTPEEDQRLALLMTVQTELNDAISRYAGNADLEELMSSYNEIAFRYGYLNIPGMEPVDKKLNTRAIDITYALFKGNVAYLRIDGFMLSSYLDSAYIKHDYGKPSARTKAVIDEVAATWKAWFDAIQVHHKAGDLGGVIIDVRNNGGGFVDDYRYVLGALLPSGGHHVTDARFKRGPGRYDYSPVMPQYLPTMKEEHVTVTEPIVVLCNCTSVSMAEQTSLGVKTLDNGTLIGTRTWGGMSALTTSDEYSNNYAGYVGEQGKTPVFCYVPMELVLSQEGKVMEGYGVKPDIELPLDYAAWNKGSGPDNQLERALSLIRTGN